MTFLPWVYAKRGTLGNGETAAVAYGIAADALEYGQARLREHEVAVELSTRLGDTVLSFERWVRASRILERVVCAVDTSCYVERCVC